MRMTTLARRAYVALILVALTVVACGGPESSATGVSTEGTGQPAEGNEGDCSERLQQIYDEVDGLDWDARREALLEFAQQEDGALMLYASSGQVMVDGLVEEFTATTDLDVDVYRAGNTDVMRRVTEERKAGGVRGDVLLLNDPEITILARESFFAPLSTPATEQLHSEYVHEDRAGVAILHYTVGRNTDFVSDEEAPTTWEEALTYDGDIYLEEKSWDWFAAIVNYLVDEQGMTEDEAVQLFREAAGRAQITSGRTATVQQLMAGGADLSPSLFLNGIEDAVEAGAPIAWQPTVQPMPGRSNDVAILADCTRPAKSLLFADSVLTDGQAVVGSLNYTPATTEKVETFDLPMSEYDTIRMDIDMLIDERPYWEDLYMDVIAAGTKVEAPAEGGGG